MTTPSNHPSIEMMPLASLLPNPKNPRKHSKKQLAQIAASIERFGFVVPIIVDEARRIVAGHGRWEAAKLLKLPLAPVILVSFVTDEDRRAFALAENRLAELSDWDQDLLTAELSDLFEGGYDITITGFSLADLDFSIDGTAEEPEEIELPSNDAVAVSEPGDLWLAGQHRLLCGDAGLAASYEALLGGELATMIFADPPYNVRIDGHVSGLGKVRHREFAQASGEMSQSEFTQFLRRVFRHCASFSVDGSIHYQCMDWRHIREILDAADGVYDSFKQLVVWNKDNSAGMGTFYRSQHELLFVFKSGRRPHINNFGLGETGRYRTNVWSYAGASSFRKGRQADLADHPTVKPTALVADAILDCSNRNDLILDPFSGSGTTLLACHATGRRGAAIEIDPLYVDTALRRLAASSGLSIVHADGRSFEQVAADRLASREIDNG